MWLVGNKALWWSALWAWGKSGALVWVGAPIPAAKPPVAVAQKVVQKAPKVAKASPTKKAKEAPKKIAAKTKQAPKDDEAKGGVTARDARTLKAHSHRGARLHAHVVHIPKIRDLRAGVLPTQKTGKLRLSSPLPGHRVGSHFGWRMGPLSGRIGKHRGWDYGARFGTPIKASASGYVWRTGWMGSCGLGVVLIHRDGLSTVYCHLSQVLASHRKRVRRGQIIGRVGSTGSSTSPHLHFGVLHKRKFVDPAFWMKKKK